MLRTKAEELIYCFAENSLFQYTILSIQSNTVQCNSWFRHTRYTSFQRQLNVYGFQRITKGPDKNAYYSKFFVRGQPNLVSGMKRFVNKRTFVRRPANPETEPNFYVMPFLPSDAQTSAPAVIPPSLQTALRQSNYTLQQGRILLLETLSSGVTLPSTLATRSHGSQLPQTEALLFSNQGNDTYGRAMFTAQHMIQLESLQRTFLERELASVVTDILVREQDMAFIRQNHSTSRFTSY
jgi:HSF-type DNA-binding